MPDYMRTVAPAPQPAHRETRWLAARTVFFLVPPPSKVFNDLTQLSGDFSFAAFLGNSATSIFSGKGKKPDRGAHRLLSGP